MSCLRFGYLPLTKAFLGFTYMTSWTLIMPSCGLSDLSKSHLRSLTDLWALLWIPDTFVCTCPSGSKASASFASRLSSHGIEFHYSHVLNNEWFPYFLLVRTNKPRFCGGDLIVEEAIVLNKRRINVRTFPKPHPFWGLGSSPVADLLDSWLRSSSPRHQMNNNKWVSFAREEICASEQRSVFYWWGGKVLANPSRFFYDFFSPSGCGIEFMWWILCIARMSGSGAKVSEWVGQKYPWNNSICLLHTYTLIDGCERM